jgi:alpha-L-fucosidase
MRPLPTLILTPVREETGVSSWFDGARFGLFVHWTHIAQRGWELSWPLVGGIDALPEGRGVPVDDYYSKVLDFRPDRDAPREWIRAAKEAGMRYAILTTKHHDGFALWPTKLTDFSVAQTPYDGDIVGEFAEAARDEGLRVGFYYSLSDWHHPDYPAFRESDKPYLKFLGRRSDTWNRYLDVMFGQVQELLTNYGKIDVLWFDGQWERTVDEWRAPELISTIRELQPEILINDRLPGGDYETPEQGVPEKVPDGRWETCMTMNRSWGYVPHDKSYKSTTELVHTLCEVAGKGGNFLLNVSPRADGSLPPEQTKRLEAVGSWMKRNAESIHDTSPGLEPWQFYGPSTRKGNHVFLHSVMRPYETVVARGLPIRRVLSAKHVATGRDLSFKTRATVQQEFFTNDPIGEIAVEVPEDLIEPHATVIELIIESGL